MSNNNSPPNSISSSLAKGTQIDTRQVDFTSSSISFLLVNTVLVVIFLQRTDKKLQASFYNTTLQTFLNTQVNARAVPNRLWQDPSATTEVSQTSRMRMKWQNWWCHRFYKRHVNGVHWCILFELIWSPNSVIGQVQDHSSEKYWNMRKSKYELCYFSLIWTPHAWESRDSERSDQVIFLVWSWRAAISQVRYHTTKTTTHWWVSKNKSITRSFSSLANSCLVWELEEEDAMK